LSLKYLGFFRSARQGAGAHRKLRGARLTGVNKQPKFNVTRGAPQVWG
jgi:hypothetical protein